MFEINIDPIVRLGPLGIYWSGIGFIVSVAVVIIMGTYEAKRRGIRMIPWRIEALFAAFLIGSTIGGKLFYVLDNWEYLSGNPMEIIFSYSILLHGVLFCGLIALAICTKISWINLVRINFWRLGDIIAPGSMLGIALYRIGCTLTGCCYGLPATVPWAVVYTNPDSAAPVNILIHPTQLYHLFLGLLAFIALWFLRNRMKPEGALFLLWLILFAIGDFVVRLFRVAQPFIFDWQLAQIADVVILAITVPWFVIRNKRAAI